VMVLAGPGRDAAPDGDSVDEPPLEPTTRDPGLALGVLVAPLVDRGFSAPVFVSRDAAIVPGEVRTHDAVVGPGNRWVMEAKRQVAGEVIIDSPAGPSEVLVLADASTDPTRAADELVAQAEHDPDAAVVLVATDAAVLEATETALASALERAPRSDVAREALAGQGALLLAGDLAEACGFAAAWGAEHLSILTAEPREELERIPTAGTVFLGGSASVAYGDYLTGANHVLPTGGTSRSFSGLSALDFLRAYTWQEIDPEGAAGMADAVARLAEAEGLPGHAAAARSAAGGDR